MQRVMTAIRHTAEQYPERIAYKDQVGQVTYQDFVSLLANLYKFLEEQALSSGDIVWNVVDREIDYFALALVCSDLNLTCCLAEKEMLDESLMASLYHQGSRQVIVETIGVSKGCLTERYQIAKAGKTHGSSYLIFFTSGTTGIPKGVRCRYDQFSFSSDRIEVGQSDIVVITQKLRYKPFFSQAVACFSSGHSLYSVQGDARTLLADMARDQLQIQQMMTNIAGVRYLLSTSDLLPMISQLTVTGGMLTPMMRRSLMEKFSGTRMTNLYGQTELGVIAMISEAEWSESPFCVGEPTFFNQVSIREGKRQLADGELGHICVSSFYAYEGYSHEAPECQAVVGTGDIGCLKSGQLYLFGRAVEAIQHDDRQVFAQELTFYLEEHIGDWRVQVSVQQGHFMISGNLSHLNNSYLLALIDTFRLGLSSKCRLIS